MLRRLVPFALLAVVSATISASESQRIILDVRGMDCATCPITVKTILRRQSGVEGVKVDFGKKTAEITFDPSKASPEKLAQVVTEAGFPSTPRK